MSTQKAKVYVHNRDSLNYDSALGICDVLNPDEADAILFTGGADIHPSLYGEKKCTYTGGTDNERDKSDVDMFKKYVGKKKFIGICRGAQFLCVMAGGKLVHHMNRCSNHYLWVHPDCPQTIGLNKMMVSSDHHQAQWPWVLPKDSYKILGYSRNMSAFHLSSTGEEMSHPDNHEKIEVEDVYYPKIGALGIQCHPEWMDCDSDAVVHYKMLVNLLMEERI